MGGADLRPRKLMKNKKNPLIAFFALHQRQEQKKFRRALLRPFKPIFFLPAEEIKDYYGEQIALYFSFLGHYTRWLIPAGLLGFIFFMYANFFFSFWRSTFCFHVFLVWRYQLAVGGKPGAIVPGLEGFALAMCIWATAFLEGWKRKTAQLRQVDFFFVWSVGYFCLEPFCWAFLWFLSGVRHDEFRPKGDGSAWV